VAKRQRNSAPGYLGHESGKCRCTPEQILRYRRRISGPLLDRIDIQIEVPALSQEELLKAQDGEASEAIRLRVEAAAQRQAERQKKANSKLTTREIERLCKPDAQGEALLKQAISRLNLSARGYHRVLKVARTAADLAASPEIRVAHLAEAVQYRRLDRGG